MNEIEVYKGNELEVAELYSNSPFVPAHFRNKPENTIIAVNMSRRVNADPYMIMKGLYDVHGTLAMDAKLMIALVNMTDKWGPLHFEFMKSEDGKITGCECKAKHLKTGDICDTEITWATVEAEGWLRNPKWKTMTKQMLRYRSAAFWCRLYCPEALMGMHTLDEVEDFAQPIDVSGVEMDVVGIGELASEPDPIESELNDFCTKLDEGKI